MIKKPKNPIWYGGRLFRPVTTNGASETTSETIFKYEQKFDLVTGTYSGGEIEFGQLIATIQPNGNLDMRYQHRNKSGELMTGHCHSVPEIMPDGKMRLHETWQWTCQDNSHGTSILEEI
ncbi:hypothetical protein DES40_1846 [Litorimonas taeanensis]|uniref:N-acetylglutamate synthase n=1 Tax=Litorimonas taeanensis TaxID=568099 RepID=A0A420WDJ7_9PROT|nr:hypothetical protein [Litorimonas taeanensis]RKQ69066.1 hypothetical protein DES40_1846 [Litorimonas taeanensis]